MNHWYNILNSTKWPIQFRQVNEARWIINKKHTTEIQIETENSDETNQYAKSQPSQPRQLTNKIKAGATLTTPVPSTVIFWRL